MKTFRDFILECELVESIQPLPREKMLDKIRKKSKDASSSLDAAKTFRDIDATDIVNTHKKELKKKSSQIKKMKTKMRTHDPVDSRFRELENRDRGEKK